ncbi:MAG TPA: hypothetical protein PKN52_07275, partial [Trueperaceae bacterium]|nr:hypothetical protein [Trueperaceae bacterium]
MTLQDYANQVYQKHSLASEKVKSFVSKTEVAGKPNQRRLSVVLADRRNEILIVEKDSEICEALGPHVTQH